ncbi:inositol monophosphatase family protein [Aestuariibius sp. HNIBRBA575]|uniref:inositol monophosphatase family protein n=1 Tax=Aestuariibius sp. HNIBRBA575 TaxID=3233343 RepID=UPI0034A240CE
MTRTEMSPKPPLTTIEQNQIVLVAHRLADAARVETLAHFRNQALTEDNKLAKGFDPVTVGDRNAERAMRDILDRDRPDDAILGEEFGAKPGKSGLTWVLDPIDGTRGFISGTPTWGVLISIADETGPLYGIIDQPYIGERFEGGFGRADMNGPQGPRKLCSHAPRDLSDAIVLSTFPEINTPRDQQGFQAVANKTKLTRYGMDCYGYALIATGQVDLVIEAGLQAYDIQAPIAVVQAAGGVVTNWRGDPAHQGGQVIAAANAQIHAQALALLAPFAD